MHFRLLYKRQIAEWDLVKIKFQLLIYHGERALLGLIELITQYKLHFVSHY